jgi:hypothetical protein
MYTRSVPKEIKDMLRDIASSTNNDYQLIEDVYFHEFDFVAKQIAKGDRNDYLGYENILLKHFGSFLANEKHVNKLIQIANAKKDNNDTTCP